MCRTMKHEEFHTMWKTATVTLWERGAYIQVQILGLLPLISSTGSPGCKHLHGLSYNGSARAPEISSVANIILNVLLENFCWQWFKIQWISMQKPGCTIIFLTNQWWCLSLSKAGNHSSKLQSASLHFPSLQENREISTSEHLEAYIWAARFLKKKRISHRLYLLNYPSKALAKKGGGVFLLSHHKEWDWDHLVECTLGPKD